MPYWIYTGTAIIYAIRIAVFIIGAIIERNRIIRASKGDENNQLPFVSVIVPARNEENNIRSCIQSLLQSDYPIERLEIIIINDRSSDSTGSIADELHSKYPHIRALHLTEERTGNLRGKPGALDAAMNIAKGEIILMTDADCEVQPTWVSMLVRQFSEKTGLVASFTTIHPSTIFAQMQSVEWVLTHTMASAGIGLKQPLGCFGNNLAIRKKTYYEVGGYNGIPFSVTEDLALLQTVIKKGWEVRYVCDYSCAVETLPCETLGEYVRQHHRWLRGGTALGWRGAVFVLFSASLWVSLATAIVTQSWMLLPVILMIRLLGDLAVIAPSLSALRRKDLYPWALLAVFFITALELVIPFSLLKREVVWKGQRFR